MVIPCAAYVWFSADECRSLDVIHKAINALDALVHFDQVCMTPGNQVVFATLPGNDHGQLSECESSTGVNGLLVLCMDGTDANRLVRSQLLWSRCLAVKPLLHTTEDTRKWRSQDGAGHFRGTRSSYFE